MTELDPWKAWAEAGHGNHDGWTIDSRDGLLRCSCGAVIGEAMAA